MYYFEHRNHGIHLSFIFQIFSKLFLCAYSFQLSMYSYEIRPFSNIKITLLISKLEKLHVLGNRFFPLPHKFVGEFSSTSFDDLNTVLTDN